MKLFVQRRDRFKASKQAESGFVERPESTSYVVCNVAAVVIAHCEAQFLPVDDDGLSGKYVWTRQPLRESSHRVKMKLCKG